jgi:DNA-binding response OmpR family regulator
MSKHIMLVDDDALLRRSLAFSLVQAGYRVSPASNAEDALTLAQRDSPDLILLDIGLPGMDGLDALRYFKAQSKVPIIFLTARRRELDEVLGLKLGAEDYITKPFDQDVLLARIEVVLRRTKPAAYAAVEQPGPLVVGDLTIDPAAHIVTLRGQRIDLPPREFDLLRVLATEAGHVVSIDGLLARAWGAEFEGDSQAIYVHIRLLRKKLEQDPKHPQRIITIRGVGYKLEPQEK